MSWPARAGSAPPPPERAPDQPPRAHATQPYNNQQNMYSNYQGVPFTANPQQQQYWQQPPPGQYSQQYSQVYQQDYGTNANQFYQQPQYNQNYTNPAYNTTQQGYQGYYQNQRVHQTYPQNKPNTDAWEDNWDWGWDESSKAQNAVAKNQPPMQATQQQVFNNANVIEESFASTDTWNWSMEDKKQTSEPPAAPKQEPATLPVENAPLNSAVNESVSQRSANNLSAQQPNEEVRTLDDRDVVKEKLPNLALGKRFHLDNLTPQWSIESQMSQESSDGPQTHSEGTYRSENQSRNSSKSSPGPNTDNSNFNYSQSGLDEYPQSSEWSRHTIEEPTILDNQSRRESHDDLSSSMNEMSLANRENPAPDTSRIKEVKSISENVGSHVPPAVSPASFASPVSSLPQPPPLSSVSMSSLPPVSIAVAPSSSSPMLPPPTNSTPSSSSSSTNPFKQSGPFSHKKIPTGSLSIQSFPSPISNTNLASPAAVNKASQHRVPVGFGANLETTPDNSERPDQPQLSGFRPTPVLQPVPDNLEVAPQNDRNEYLQTAHLSSGDYGENTDFSRSAPPPGLRRMVVGQQEPEYQNLNISGDDPPPSFARMVPGQQTEIDNSYNQPGDNYMERHIDGQPTDSGTGGARPYRQPDGQITPDNYTQSAPNRVQERRPIGLDRMVPGEPSNDEYPQYQGSNYAGNDQRVVMGVDHDYPMPIDAGPSDIREQNVDGSDYSEQTPRNPPRNVIGAREVSNDVTQDFPPADEQQREVIMEGENLQDLSVISSAELAFSREQTLDGADVNTTDAGADRKTDLSDSIEHAATSSRRQSLNRGTSGDESDRDRAFKASPRRDRDKHKSSRDRDRDRDKEGRYSRGDRKYDREPERRAIRDDRRTDKERRDRERERRPKDESPEARRHRRSTRSHRYETEDTDYYSDRERDRRRYREGSYTSKPPRPEDKGRRHEERERSRRYNTIERDKRYEERERRDRDRDRYPRYRDIDPARKYGNIKKERDDDDRRRVVTFSGDANSNAPHSGEGGEAYSSGSRPGSREAPATDDDLLDAGADARRRDRRARHRHDRERDPYYDGYGALSAGVVGGAVSSAGDPYLLQRQQYQYYDHLRRTDPAAYMHIYKQLMAGRAPATHADYPHAIYRDGYGSLGYEGRGEERGSVHSGRSSGTGHKGNDTFYVVGAAYRGSVEAGSLRDAPSLRTDLSDRDLNTDASLNLHLEDSTVRSERMTPFKFSTAHIKGNISSRDVVVVRPSYPVDGRPATVHILSLSAALAAEPLTLELSQYPGPLVKGVTHKKSVIDYCGWRAREAGRAAPRDPVGYVLLWDLLALLLRQNGVVVGADIAELLMKNKREYEYKTSSSSKTAAHNDSRRGSSVSGRDEDGRTWSPEQPSASTSDLTPQDELSSPATHTALDDRAALDKLREYLIYGNRQDALEWAMSNQLWGHALSLAAHCDRRARGAVSARFLAALPRNDPLHTLYSHLQAKQPPAATCTADERWGDWRPHAAIMLSNSSAKPDQDRKTLTQLGDSLSSRGLVYSAQFCYLSAGVQIARHPLAPLQPAGPGPNGVPCPRLALLLSDPRATSLRQLATNTAIFATEIYEYALSLSHDYVIKELQVYKLILATRLVDAGAYERALAYAEQAARAVTRAPADYSPALVAQLAELADRLKYHEPSLTEDPPLVDEGGDSGEPSPRHHQQWLQDVKSLAHMLQAEASHHSSPHHHAYDQQLPAPAPAPAPLPVQTAAPFTWGDQTQQQFQPPPPPQSYDPEESADYSQLYQQQQQQQQSQQPPAPQQQQPPPQQGEQQQQSYSYGEEWPPRSDDTQPSYGDQYWAGDSGYYAGYGEAGADAGAAAGAGGEAGEARPMITMPGTAPSKPSLYTDFDDDRPPSAGTDRDTDTPKTAAKKTDKPKEESKDGGKGKGGWLGGILTKLTLRQPNQMILPDDKNPTIVWDAEHKRWRNLDADDDAAAAPPPPPPKLADIAAHMQNSTSSPAPPAAGVPPPTTSAGAPPPAAPMSNIFKMQKGRHIKKSYVDVFNPSGAPTRPLPPPSEVLGPALATNAPAPNYFVPSSAPVNQLINVSIPSTPADSPRPSPSQGGGYDPSQNDNLLEGYRHGI